MNNLREVKDDLLKEWIEYREETIFAIMNEEDKKHEIRYDEITEKILKRIKAGIKRSNANRLVGQKFLLNLKFLSSLIKQS